MLGFLQKVKRGLRRQLRLLQKDAIRIARDEFCGMHLNWALPPGRWNTMSKVHWNYSKALYRRGRLFAIVSSLAWPFISTIFAWKKTRMYGAEIKKKTGMTLVHQLLDQVWMANRYYVPPRAYYYYGLYRLSNRKQATQYVQDYEIMPLLNMLNGDIDYDIFDDKLKFFAQCKNKGLRTIPILAHFENGHASILDGNYPLEQDLFAKPQKGKCGQGAILYPYEGNGKYRNSDGSVLREKGLHAHLTESSKEQSYILQKRIGNHSVIAELSQGALCTSRIITCMDLSGYVHLVTAIFKMSTRDTYTDNFATGGIAVPIDMDTGILGQGITKELAIERISVHPDTGVAFSGFRIPFWDQATALCRRAHEAFPAYAFIGWDIAIDEDGPILVEGNLQWGVESLQMAHDLPLGIPLFGFHYVAHVDNKRDVN